MDDVRNEGNKRIKKEEEMGDALSWGGGEHEAKEEDDTMSSKIIKGA